MLAQVPVYSNQKTRGEEDNHAGDATPAGDMLEKRIQQRVLDMASSSLSMIC